MPYQDARFSERLPGPPPYRRQAIPLTADEVVKIGEQFRKETRFALRKQYVENWRSYRWGEMPVSVEGIGDLLEHRSPVAEVHVDRYRNRMRSAAPRILVSAKNQAGVESAQKVEDFFYALVFDFRRQRTGKIRSADNRALDYQVADGCGVRHLAWAPDVLSKLFKDVPNSMDEELPKAMQKVFRDGFQGNPFELRAPDWLATYFDDDTSTVCEYGEVRVSILKDLYGDDESVVEFLDVTTDTRREDQHHDRMIDYYHLETKEYVYDCLHTAGDGYGNERKSKLVRCYPNAAGRPRYTFAAGNESSGDELHQQFRPTIAPIYKVIGEVNLYGTLLNSQTLMSGRAPYQEVKVGKQDDAPSILDRPGDERRVMWIDPREAIWPEPRPGYKWEPVPVPDMSIVENRYQQRMAEIREWGFPNILSPTGPSPDQSASSGYQAAIEQQGAADFLEPPLENLALSWHELCLLAQDSIMEVGVPVSMALQRRSQGDSKRVTKVVRVEPKDFEAVGNVDFRFESVSQTTEFAKDEANRRDVQQRLMPRSYYFQGRYDNWSEAMEQLDKDEIEDGATQIAAKTALAFLEANAQQYTDQQLAAAGLPTTSQRLARPPGGAMPGVGAPLTPPPQTPEGQIAPVAPPAVTGGVG